MKFKIDENLPVEAAQVLSAAGYDAHTVGEEQLEGTPDSKLLAVCQDEGRALVTLDAGFGDIRAYPPEEHAGIIVLRPSSQDKPTLLRLLSRLVPLLASNPVERHLWVVEESRIRLRGDRAP